jgi:hypothetical protein
MKPRKINLLSQEKQAKWTKYTSSKPNYFTFFFTHLHDYIKNKINMCFFMCMLSTLKQLMVPSSLHTTKPNLFFKNAISLFN